MNIFVPYTKILDPTRFCLRDYEYTPIKLDESEGYWRFFRNRWREGKSFISVEQDIIFWPGALESLWNCPSKWCAFGYSITGVPAHPRSCPPLGLVKFSDYFIQETPNLWSELSSRHWKDMDSGIFEWVNKQDGKVLGCHIHQPSVVNYHPSQI